MSATAITPAEFGYIKGLVRERSAIVLDEGKEYLVSSRLAPIARQEGVASVGELVNRLRSRPGSTLHHAVVEAMTTNETSFFRDPAVFDGLRKEILPDLIRSRAATRHLDIWSAAASTGQEAYSLVMMMKEHFPELAGWRTPIVATDLNEQVLAKARAGRYTQFEVNRGLPAPLMSRWFSRAGAEWQLDREILNAVQLRPLNLIGTARYPQVDLILLRNVLIYFDTETKRQILSRVREALRPGGYLLLGASESPLLLQSGFERADIGRGGCFRAV